MEEKRKEDNSFGVASVVFGVLSILLFWTIFPGVILGILGFIFGVIQNKKGKNKWALNGIILSVIGFVISLLFMILIISLMAIAGQAVAPVMVCIDDPTAEGCEQILGGMYPSIGSQMGSVVPAGVNGGLEAG